MADPSSDRTPRLLGLADFADAVKAERARYPLEGLILRAADGHRYDAERMCCTCGFGAWSAEHVAVMAYRQAVDRG